MSATINPDFRDLQQKVEELQITLAKTQGEIVIIKHNGERNDRQTITQLVIWTSAISLSVSTLPQKDKEMTDKQQVIDGELTRLYNKCEKECRYLKNFTPKTLKTYREILDRWIKYVSHPFLPKTILRNSSSE
jgi:hypothetical protein